MILLIPFMIILSGISAVLAYLYPTAITIGCLVVTMMSTVSVCISVASTRR
jgi:hypothetical protein